MSTTKRREMKRQRRLEGFRITLNQKRREIGVQNKVKIGGSMELEADGPIKLVSKNQSIIAKR